MLEYLHSFEGARQNPFKPLVLQQFSAPDSMMGYNNRSISNDIITDLYLDFCQRTRKEESSEYLKTVTGDRSPFHEFLCSNTVATLSNSCMCFTGQHIPISWQSKCCQQPMPAFKAMERQFAKRAEREGSNNELGTKTATLQVVDPHCDSLLFCGCAQRLCQTNAAAEIQESLEGICQCCQQLGIEVPVLVAADNCCQIRNAIIKVLPDADVVLDVYHFLMR